MDASWRRRLGLDRRVGALALGLFVYGFGQELWFRFLPAYLRFLGASAFIVGAFGTLKDLLDAAYAYPGGVIADRLGSRRALLLFGLLSTLGFTLYFLSSSTAILFLGLLLVMAWPSLGLPATFSLIGEELTGGKRIVGFTVQAVLKRLPVIIAPPVGGLLIERLGMKAGLRVGFAVSVVLTLGMLAALRNSFRERAEARPIGTETRTNPAVVRVRLHSSLKNLLVADCLVRLCEGLPDVFLVVWALEVVRVTPLQFGLLTSVLMITAVLSYLPAAALAERAEKKGFVLLTYLFFALFPVAIVLSRTFPQLLAAYVVGGLREIGEPARKALIVDLSDPRMRGRTVGLYYGIRGFAVAGAAAVGGALWMVRPELTFWTAAGLGVTGTLWTALFLPRHANSPQEVES